MTDTDRISRVFCTPREHPLLLREDQLVIVVAPLDGVFNDRGTYGSDGRKTAERHRFLHPEAAMSLYQLELAFPGCFHYTDIFRNATGSKRRRAKNRQTRNRKGLSPIYTGKLPGSSAHGFGFSADHDVKNNLHRLRALCDDPEFDKEDYDLLLREYGWYCHRDGPHGDHRKGPEWWHYNYFGEDPERWLAHSHRKTSGGVEAKIDYQYGPFVLDRPGIESHLHRLHYLATTGAPGAIPVEVVRKFQRDWTLPEDGIVGPQTQRALSYVGARFVDKHGNDVDVPFP